MSKKVIFCSTLAFIIIYQLGICMWCTFESSCQQSPDCVTHTLQKTFLHDEHAARCINRISLSLASFREQPALINALVWNTSRHSCLPDDIRPWDKAQQSKHLNKDTASPHKGPAQKLQAPSQLAVTTSEGLISSQGSRFSDRSLFFLRRSVCARAHCWRKIQAQKACAREQLRIRQRPCVAVLSDVTVRSSWTWHVDDITWKSHFPSGVIKHPLLFFHSVSSEKLKSMQRKLQWPRCNETKTTHVPNVMTRL